MAFNADEVFTIAKRVEENAAEFYTKAANLHAAREQVQLLRRLATTETGLRGKRCQVPLPSNAHGESRRPLQEKVSDTFPPGRGG